MLMQKRCIIGFVQVENGPLKPMPKKICNIYYLFSSKECTYVSCLKRPPQYNRKPIKQKRSQSQLRPLSPQLKEAGYGRRLKIIK